VGGQSLPAVPFAPRKRTLIGGPVLRFVLVVRASRLGDDVGLGGRRPRRQQAGPRRGGRNGRRGRGGAVDFGRRCHGSGVGFGRRYRSRGVGFGRGGRRRWRRREDRNLSQSRQRVATYERRSGGEERGAHEPFRQLG